MANYRLEAKLISRTGSGGSDSPAASSRSVVACAAYRAGERLHDARNGVTFDYSRKPSCEDKVILAPEGAPDWVFDRETLWGRVECSEVRRNAQLAREVMLMLPRELPLDQSVALARAFATEQFVARGMVADIAVHLDAASDGLPQPHAHILLTMRRLDGATPTGFARTKAREWNEDPEVAKAWASAKADLRAAEKRGVSADEIAKARARVERWDAMRNINVWRRRFAEMQNAFLEAAGSGARVDHRTLKAQGIDREPQKPLGWFAHKMQRAYGFMRDRLNVFVAMKHRDQMYREVVRGLPRRRSGVFGLAIRLSGLDRAVSSSIESSPGAIPERGADYER